MRVLIVSLHYWPERTGSAPPVRQMAEALARRGAAVTVLTARPFYPEMEVHEGWANGGRDAERLNGVEILRRPVAPAPSGISPRRLRAEAGFALAAWRFLRRGAPGSRPGWDAVIAVGPPILTLTAAAGAGVRRRGGRLIGVVHDIQSGLGAALGMLRFRPALAALRRLEAASLGRFDEIVTLSPAMAAQVRGLGVRRPVRVVPPTVDDAAITPLPEPEGGPPLVVYSGNLGRKQGLGQVLDLAAECARRGVEARFLIRGEGAGRAALEAAAAARGLPNLAFAPLLPEAALPAGLAAAAAHLVPVDPGGADFAAPSKIYAIMAAGRPFICTALPDSPMGRLRAACDAFVLTPPNDAAAFADALERLLADPAERRRLGANGRAFVEAHAGRAACEAACLAMVGGRPRDSG